MSVTSRALMIASALALGVRAFVTLPPRKTSMAQRLARFPRTGLPLSRPVTVRWNTHQVPYIEAGDDLDAAFVLGLVHAHLRLGQMELAKRIAHGRTAEVAGPLTADIDDALRRLGFARAADGILAAMPGWSRAWLERFADGVNDYRAGLRARELPHEYKVLGLQREPWHARDSIAIGRLGGTDINWLTLLLLLPYANDPGFADLWDTVKRLGSGGRPSFTVADGRLYPHDGAFRELMEAAEISVQMSRSGSNSVVVAPARSANGSALIANDPHLSFILPNMWLIAGLKSPSYQIVGMMPPGIPTFAFGRTPHIAWGGTNMRSLNSDFVDVTDSPLTDFTSREEKIKVRFWFSRKMSIRESPHGPVLSDAALMTRRAARSVALRWIGHENTDEVTALLTAARARNWAEFKAAFTSFAIPAQNLLVADTGGNIAQIVATQLPNRTQDHFGSMLVTPDRAGAAWCNILSTDELPFALNPDAGFIASANNRPVETDVPVGLFFTPDERIRRLCTLLESRTDLTLDHLSEIQRDVYSPLSAELRDALLARYPPPPGSAGGRLIEEWDGHYTAESRGAPAFEAFLEKTAGPMFTAAGLGDRYKLFTDLAYVRPVLLDLLKTPDGADLADAVRLGYAAADRMARRETRWGDLHRLTVQHVLGVLPVLGRRYRTANIPMPGSRETIYKSSHRLTASRHSAGYGSQSRHLSDLGDPDANYFVLLGGQDGWINSENFADHLPLWRSGRAIQMPLSEDGVRAHFPSVMTLTD